jgi:predicted DNA-binding protein
MNTEDKYLNLRLSKELHTQLKMLSFEKGCTMNKIVREYIEKGLNE